MTTHHLIVPSPVDDLLLLSDGDALTTLQFARRGGHRIDAAWKGPDAVLRDAKRQLDAYFAGKRREFALPLRPEGTEFQQRVWAALRAIPHGVTKSYGQIAREVGNASASRAVGLANGANPIAVIVPCHRVIGADGSMTGFGGGIERKRWLLAHEGWTEGKEGRREGGREQGTSARSPRRIRGGRAARSAGAATTLLWGR
jgi:methylated-DNA-[protein]-cysteine S-methyltransferase